MNTPRNATKRARDVVSTPGKQKKANRTEGSEAYQKRVNSLLKLPQYGSIFKTAKVSDIPMHKCDKHCIDPCIKKGQPSKGCLQFWMHGVCPTEAYFHLMRGEARRCQWEHAWKTNLPEDADEASKVVYVHKTPGEDEYLVQVPGYQLNDYQLALAQREKTSSNTKNWKDGERRRAQRANQSALARKVLEDPDAFDVNQMIEIGKQLQHQ